MLQREPASPLSLLERLGLFLLSQNGESVLGKSAWTRASAGGLLPVLPQGCEAKVSWGWGGFSKGSSGLRFSKEKERWWSALPREHVTAPADTIPRNFAKDWIHARAVWLGLLLSVLRH